MSAAVDSLPEAASDSLDAVGFEVATTSADTLRASIAVAGEVGPGNAALLTSVLRSHLRTGRRYLRVDLIGARITDPRVLEHLAEAHRNVSEFGGMLVFENAAPQLRDMADDDTIFLRGPV